MRATISSALALLAIAAAPAAASAAGATISVTYVDAPHYIDGRLETRFGRKTDPFVEKDLRRFFEGLGARHLGEGQDLAIEILDIDLAGRVAIARAPGENLRVMTDDTWPRVKLRYTLTRGGEVLKQGEEWVVDQTYLMRIGLSNTGDKLRYEKRMLTTWFQTRFAKEQAAAK